MALLIVSLQRCQILRSLLEYWKTAFDQAKARENELLVPERGVEEDFDDSQDRIEKSEGRACRPVEEATQGAWVYCKSCYRDIGKEIYQLEVPAEVKNVPKDWTNDVRNARMSSDTTSPSLKHSFANFKKPRKLMVKLSSKSLADSMLASMKHYRHLAWQL